MIKEYDEYDAIGLADLIKKGEISAGEAVGSAIEKIEELDKKINSVVLKMYDHAKEKIDQTSKASPLFGVPFLIKDLGINYKGFPSTGSCRFTCDYMPDTTSNLMERFLEAGLIPLGKTNTPEMGIMGVTEPKMRGPCHNPWNLDYTSGGSSGGSAAAVAARMVPLAQGGDGGGSIRIPASACGLVGLKPSRGRTPFGPDANESWMGLVVQHVLTRSVRDSALLLDLTKGADEGAAYAAPETPGTYLERLHHNPKKLRIAFSFESIYGKETHPVCRSALEESVQLCEDLGHEVIEAHPQYDKQHMVESYLTIVAVCTQRELEDASLLLNKPLKASEFELLTWFLYLAGKSLKAEDLANAIGSMRGASLILGKFFQDYDLFMTPTLAHPPSPIGLMDLKVHEVVAINAAKLAPKRILMKKMLKQMAETGLERTPNTQLFNQSGSPAISLPLYHDEPSQLPIGIQFASAYGREDRLFEIAGQLECARPWADRKPRF